jgi:hypothetical protein
MKTKGASITAHKLELPVGCDSGECASSVRVQYYSGVDWKFEGGLVIGAIGCIKLIDDIRSHR